MRNNIFVIDTNTLISAFLFSSSTTKSAFDKASKLGELTASLETYKELCDVLLRPKFDKYVLIETRLAIIKEIKELPVFREIDEKITACRDSKDNKFLELAIASKADCIISGDDDLLILNPFRGIPILNSIDFINKF